MSEATSGWRSRLTEPSSAAGSLPCSRWSSRASPTKRRQSSSLERAIRNSSKSRDIVLDPFGGSGSTSIACEKARRQARVIELDPKYVDTIALRWQQFSGDAAVLDGDGRSFDKITGEREAALLPSQIRSNGATCKAPRS